MITTRDIWGEIVVDTLSPLVDPGPELSADEVRRYSRHLVIPELGFAGQRRLRAARVCCVGAGGLGSPVLMYLAAAGVGTLGIVEFDDVESSNLQRQVIHGHADVGRPKAVSARDRIAQLNPDVAVETHQVALAPDNALEILGGYDVICDATDNFASRYLVNDACALLDKPDVWGALFRFEGQASVFWASHGPTYRDLYPAPPPPPLQTRGAEAGVFGVVCAAIGSIMATEAIKLICGIGEPLIGRVVSYDALTMTHRTVPLERQPDTPVVTTLETHPAARSVLSAQAEAAAQRAITVEQLRDLLHARDAGELDFTLIDVREPAEREICAIPGSVNIPKAEIMWGRGLDRVPRGRPVVVHCKEQDRAAECLALLLADGREDVSLVEGGVTAWVERIEPAQAAY